MDGIGSILGVVALFVALAALWFVNDVVKRIERQSQQLLEAHLKGIKEAVEECESGIKGLEKKVAESARQIADIGKKQGECGEAVAGHRAVIDKLRTDLDALDRSIPANFRTTRQGRGGD